MLGNIIGSFLRYIFFFIIVKFVVGRWVVLVFFFKVILIFVYFIKFGWFIGLSRYNLYNEKDILFLYCILKFINLNINSFYIIWDILNYLL